METSCELGDGAMRCNADDCRFRAAREGEVDEVERPSCVYFSVLEGLKRLVTGREKRMIARRKKRMKGDEG